MKKTDILRMVLEAILLLVIWQHAHWSVALAITLITVSNEVEAYSVHQMVARMKGEVL